MVRIGLIGCGEHSEIGHAVPLSRYRGARPGELELTAVCDVRPEKAELFQSKYGFLNAYSNLDEMLSKEKLDACIAVVPVERISQLGLVLLESGIPCVVEKPLGTSLTDVATLRDTAASTKTQNMVSVNRRFMPFLNRAIEWSREAGQLRYVRSTMTRHARTESEFLWTTAVHAVDALRHIAGDVRDAAIRKIKAASAAWYGIDIEFKSGVSGHIDVFPTAGVLEETYELVGDDFRAVVTAPFGPQRGLRCYRENRLVLHETDEGLTEDVVNGFYDEAAALVRAISRKEPLHQTIEEVYPSVELCLKLAKRAGTADVISANQ